MTTLISSKRERVRFCLDLPGTFCGPRIDLCEWLPGEHYVELHLILEDIIKGKQGCSSGCVITEGALRLRHLFPHPVLAIMTVRGYIYVAYRSNPKTGALTHCYKYAHSGTALIDLFDPPMGKEQLTEIFNREAKGGYYLVRVNPISPSKRNRPPEIRPSGPRKPVGRKVTTRHGTTYKHRISMAGLAYGH